MAKRSFQIQAKHKKTTMEATISGHAVDSLAIRLMPLLIRNYKNGPALGKVDSIGRRLIQHKTRTIKTKRSDINFYWQVPQNGIANDCDFWWWWFCRGSLVELVGFLSRKDLARSIISKRIYKSGDLLPTGKECHDSSYLIFKSELNRFNPSWFTHDMFQTEMAI